MGKYIGGRIAIGLASLLLLITITFFLTRVMPGSPFQTGAVSDEVLDSLEEAYGLSKPLGSQFVTYLSSLSRGHLGVSYQKPGLLVTEVIARAWPATATVGGIAVVLSLFVGIVLGMLQAVSQKRVVKGGIFYLSVLGTAIPNFVIALFLMLLLGVKLKLLPVAGLAGPANYILPVIALAAYPTAVVTRLVNHAANGELAKEYVLMAQSKGLKAYQIVIGHILKNACLPALQYMGTAAAFLLTGTFVVEQIFNIPGLGREFVLAIGNRDYTMVMGLTIFMGMVVIVLNLLTDLLSAALNPRIRRVDRR